LCGLNLWELTEFLIRMAWIDEGGVRGAAHCASQPLIPRFLLFRLKLIAWQSPMRAGGYCASVQVM
jgi:hypothetical protein